MASTFNKCRYFFDCPPNCPKRKPACQSHCDTYLKKRAELDAINAEARKKKEASIYIAENVANKRDRIAKIKRAYPSSKFHH